MADRQVTLRVPKLRGAWAPALEAITQGHVIEVEGYKSEMTIGMLKRDWIKNQGFIIRTRVSKKGTIAWLEQR